MSLVTRAGKRGFRPSWNYGDEPGDNQFCILQMVESLRNATEQVRDELIKLNRVFACGNFLGMPRQVQEIARNTRKRKYVRKVGAGVGAAKETK